MRILVVGAGAIGRYFGGRLLETRRDVTFLVRSLRASSSDEPDFEFAARAVTSMLPRRPCRRKTLREPFDLVLVSCKAYDLPAAMDAIAPAVRPHTVILRCSTACGISAMPRD